MKNNIYKFKILTSQEFVHGVSTRYFGSIKNNGKINKKSLKGFLDALRVEIKSVVFPEQVHGSSVMTIGDSKKQFILSADGLITNNKKVFLGVVTADCLPVIFYDNRLEIAGIAHGGHKGILKGILKNMVLGFKRLGSDTQNILVAIGPSIGVCCYDVPRERIKMFDKFLSSDGDSRRTSFARMTNLYQTRSEKYFLDLKNITLKILVKRGIQRKNIEISPICTKDNLGDFFSFRGEGREKFGEFATIVGMI